MNARSGTSRRERGPGRTRPQNRWTMRSQRMSVLSNLPLVPSSFLRLDKRPGKFRKKIGVSQKESNRARA